MFFESYRRIHFSSNMRHIVFITCGNKNLLYFHPKMLSKTNLMEPVSPNFTSPDIASGDANASAKSGLVLKYDCKSVLKSL